MDRSLHLRRRHSREWCTGNGSDGFPAVRTTHPHHSWRQLEMRVFTRKLVHFLRTEDGPTAVEYAVMLALIIVVCIAAITTLGSNANGTFNNVALNGAV